MKRIKDKIKEIGEFLEQLKKMIPSSFDEYKSDIKTKSACERYVEKVIEAVVDLAFLVIKYKKLKLPQDDVDAFNILLENKIIDDNTADNLKEAKGMRNILAHEYGKVDDEIIFDAITQELEDDINKFIKNIREIVK